MAYPLFLAKMLIRTGLARFLPSVQRRLDGGGDYLRYYSDRLLAAPLAELEQVAELLEPQGPDVIDLTPGAPRFDLLPSTTTKLPADRRGWPPFGGLPELRSAVAEKLQAENQLPFSPGEEVLITAGALGAVQTALDALVNRGDRIVLLDPASPLYLLAARTRRARVRWLPTWLEEGRLRFRLDHLARALRGARLLVLCSPSNPTGGIIAPEDLEQIAWWADRYDVLLLSDEVFERFRYEGEFLSIGTISRARRRTLTVGSVSKGYGLASARVGWLTAYRHLLRPCLATAALRSPFVPILCQQLAAATLRQDPAVFARVRAEFDSRRLYTFERLRGMGLAVERPAGAFFVWAPIGGHAHTAQVFAERLLRDKRVRVTPGELFGPSGTGHVRISYATEDGRLHQGLSRIAEFVSAAPLDILPMTERAA